MITDKMNTMADAAVLTGATKIVSDIIDLGVAGDAFNGMAELYLYIRIDTAVTRAAGAVGTTFSLQTHTAADFSAERTVLWKSADIAKATLVAGYEVAKIRIPSGVLRYLAVVADHTTAAPDAGKFDAYIVPAIQANDL